MTHAIRFHKTGGPEVLVWEEVAVGKPGPGEARIRHTAVGLNFVDIYNRSGVYPAQLPSGLGGEAAGVVERRLYSEHPPRYEYELTQAGQELRAVLTVLRGWGDRWAVDAPPTAFEHSCGHDLDPEVICRHCGVEIVPEELKVRVLTDILEGKEVGTLFLAQGASVPAWKRWIGYNVPPKGRLVLDEGARRAVEESGKSLLAIGVKEVSGEFDKGQIVALDTPPPTTVINLPSYCPQIL